MSFICCGGCNVIFWREGCCTCPLWSVFHLFFTCTIICDHDDGSVFGLQQLDGENDHVEPGSSACTFWMFCTWHVLNNNTQLSKFHSYFLPTYGPSVNQWNDVGLTQSRQGKKLRNSVKVKNWPVLKILIVVCTKCPHATWGYIYVIECLAWVVFLARLLHS